MGKVWVTSEPIRARAEGAVAPVGDRKNEHWCETAERLFHLSMQQSWRLIEVNHLLPVMSDSATLTPSVRSDPGLTAVLPRPALTALSQRHALGAFGMGFEEVHHHTVSLYCGHTRASKPAVGPEGKQLLKLFVRANLCAEKGSCCEIEITSEEMGV